MKREWEGRAIHREKREKERLGREGSALKEMNSVHNVGKTGCKI